VRVFGGSLPQILEDYRQLPALENRLEMEPHLRGFICQFAEARVREAKARAAVLRRRRRTEAMTDCDTVAQLLEEDYLRLKAELEGSSS